MSMSFIVFVLLGLYRFATELMNRRRMMFLLGYQICIVQNQMARFCNKFSITENKLLRCNTCCENNIVTMTCH